MLLLLLLFLPGTDAVREANDVPAGVLLLLFICYRSGRTLVLLPGVIAWCPGKRVGWGPPFRRRDGARLWLTMSAPSNVALL